MSKHMRVADALKQAGIDIEGNIKNSPYKGVLTSSALEIDVVQDTRDGAYYKLEPFGTFNPEMVPVDQDWVEAQQGLIDTPPAGFSM